MVLTVCICIYGRNHYICNNTLFARTHNTYIHSFYKSSNIKYSCVGRQAVCYAMLCCRKHTVYSYKHGMKYFNFSFTQSSVCVHCSLCISTTYAVLIIRFFFVYFVTVLNSYPVRGKHSFPEHSRKPHHHAFVPALVAVYIFIHLNEHIFWRIFNIRWLNALRLNLYLQCALKTSHSFRCHSSLCPLSSL